MARSIHTRRRLGEAVQVMHEGAWFLGVVRQLWPPPRGEQWRYTVELDGGEMIVANAADIQRQKHVRTNDPTPEEIWGPLTAAIRAEWPEQVRLQRMGKNPSPVVEVQEVHRCRASYLGGSDFEF